MSIKLMSAAWDCPISSTQKLVLLSLADNAGVDGTCWPSIRTVARKCGKDERSVRRIMAELVRDGHISRIIRPGQSNLWHVHPNGDMDDGMYRYIYRIEADSGLFYLGRRRSPYEPSHDEYMGSGTWVQNAIAAKIPLRKIILSVHETDDELAEAEAKIIGLNIADPLCMNARNERAGKNDRGQICPERAGKNDRGGRANLPPKPSRTIIEPSVGAKAPKRAGVNLPHWIPLEPWLAYIEMRKAKRAVPTVRAVELLIAKLDRLRENGHDPGEVLDQSTEHNWTGLFEIRENSNGHRRTKNSFASLRGSRPSPALDMVLQAERELQAEAQRENQGDDWPPWPALPSC